MKFLLTAVNAKYIHSNPAVYSLEAYALCKAPSLRGCIEIAEYTINLQREDVLADIYFRKPDVIGFSCYIWNITYIEELIREIKKLLPGVHIWLGGPEVSYDAPSLLERYPQLTGIMLGEGEQTFLELMQRYMQTEDWQQGAKPVFDDIAGLALPGTGAPGSAPRLTPPRTLTSLSEIPFLYDELDKFENKIIYYESSRGCPFRCSYCLSSIDKQVRLRRLEIVKRELQFFLDHRVSQVKFVDRTFNCNKEHALAIWTYLLEHDNGITNFHFEIAADILDEEELLLLQQFRPGAVQLEIGVQSTNEQTILEIDRRMNVDKLRQVVKRIHAGRNIHVHLDLIAGLPYEDYASFAHSFDDVYAMAPQQLQLGFLKVLKGSKMHENAGSYGINYTDSPPYEVLYSNWVRYEDVRRLKQIEEMVEIYYNSNQFTTTLPLLVRLFQSPFAFFEALALFYTQQGYFVQSPARSYRYQVLLEFVRERVLAQAQIGQEDCREPGAQGRRTTVFADDLYAEALTVDLYLRDNVKTRPDFAPELTDCKEEMRTFYRREAQSCFTLGDAYRGLDARALAKMTHMEPIHYDFDTGKELAEMQYLLFDYKKRSPLTGDARICVVKDAQTQHVPAAYSIK